MQLGNFGRSGALIKDALDDADSAATEPLVIGSVSDPPSLDNVNLLRGVVGLPQHAIEWPCVCNAMLSRLAIADGKRDQIKQSLNLLQAPKSARVRLWAATHGVFPAIYRSHGPSRAAVFAEASAARRPSACPLSSASSDLGLEEETTRWITVKQSFDPCAHKTPVPTVLLDSGPQVIPGALLLSPVRAPGRRHR